MTKLVVALLGIAGTFMLAGPIVAQSTGPWAERGGAEWVTGWSPFAPIADLPRALPGPPTHADLLLLPAPRVGLTWTVGNPAGLAFEVPDSHGALDLQLAGENGAYRRPLDQDGLSTKRVSALRWQPLGERSAVAGRVVAEEVTSSYGGFSPEVWRHPSDPFLIADTTTTAMRLVRVRLEGAIGWRFGAWGAGIAPGLEVLDNRTQRSSLPRFVRASAPAVSAGISRGFADDRLMVSTYGRWRSASEKTTFVAWPQLGVVHRLQGYGEPTPIHIGGSPSNLNYERFTERRALAGGIATSAQIAGVQWVAFGERTRMRDRHHSVRGPDVPTDRWSADGWRAGTAASRSIFADRLHVMASAEYTTLTGDALRADLDDVIFDSRERAMRTAIDMRFVPESAPWMVATRFTLGWEERVRHDYLVEVGSAISGWTPGFALEIARRLGPGTFLSAGSGVAFYQPNASFPNPATLGPVYRMYVAPELALYGAAARPFASSLTLRHQVSTGVGLVMRGRANWLSPTGTVNAITEEGERTRWEFSLGVVVDR